MITATKHEPSTIGPAHRVSVFISFRRELETVVFFESGLGTWSLRLDLYSMVSVSFRPGIVHKSDKAQG